MEIQVITNTSDQAAVDLFLLAFSIYLIGTPVSVKAVVLRQSTKIKLPDANNACYPRATARFSPAAHGVLVPYIL